MKRLLVGVNAKNLRVGESHHRAKLADWEVELIIEMHDDHGWGYRRIAAKFGVSAGTVRDYVKGRRRAQHPSAWRGVLTPSRSA